MQEIIAKFSVFTTEEFIFFALALIFFIDLLYFLWAFFKVRSFVRNSYKTSAVVSEVRLVNGEQMKYEELTLVFKDISGIEFAPVVENRFKPRAKGERVDILYVKNDPANVMINEWRALYLKPLALFIGLVVTVFLGKYMLEHHLMVIPKF